MKKKSWYKKIGGGIFETKRKAVRRSPAKRKSRTVTKSNDEVIVEGGLELLSRLVTSEISRGEMLEKYKKSLYVFACINKIAMKVASVDVKMYRIVNSAGDVKEIKAHPALDLIYKVNPFQTKTEFMEITMINLKCTGDAFWYKVRNNGGQVVELWNIRPDLMTIVTDPVEYIKGYEMRKNNGTKVFFAPEDIIHHKYPDPLNQYMGVAPIMAAQKRILTEEYATQWQTDFFLNSARPDGLIKNQNSTLSKDQKEDIRESWNKRHSGLKNAYKVAILEGGLDYQQISISQKEMDYIESLKFTRDDILVAFQVPKPIVAIVDDVNRANSETAMAIFLGETIKPEVNRLWEKANEQMILTDFGEDFYVEPEDPTPENREIKLKEYETGLKNRYLLINEVRALEGMPPIKGGWSFYGTLAEIPMGGLSVGEQKMLFQKVMDDGKENEKIITNAKTVKKVDWRGKYWLKKKFEIYEEIEKEALKVFKEDYEKRFSTGKNTKQKKFISLLKDAEMKKIYYDMINKKVDKLTDNLKDSADGFFGAQEKRVLEKLAKKKSKASLKKISAEGILNYDKEVGLTIDFIIPFIEKYLKDSGQEALNMLAPQEDFQDSNHIQAIIEKRAKMFAETVNSTTLEKLGKTLAEGISDGEGIVDLRNRVEEVYEEFPEYRSEMIARTEATAANNEGALQGFKQSDVATGKEWINSGDSKVRDSHKNGSGVGGEIVKLDEEFSNGLMYPSEPNCRCVIGPAFLED